MLPAIIAAVAEVSPVILLPVTMVVGFVGYNIESYIRSGKTENAMISTSVSKS